MNEFNRRRRYFIDPPLQISMFLFSLFLIVVAVAFTVAVFYAALHAAVVELSKAGYLDSSRFAEVFYPRLTYSLVFAFFVILCFTFAMVMLYSNKIAGPLYRLRKYMEIVSDGNFSVRVSFRKGDKVRELADAFNSMVESLQNRQRQALSIVEELERGKRSESEKLLLSHLKKYI